MKKLILVISIMVSVGSSVAQVQFGIKAGYNLANFTYFGAPVAESFSFKSGFNAGIVVSVPLSASFYLQPEIVYSGQGSDYAFNPNPQMTAHLKYNYNYLNLPFLFKYQHEKGFFVETGPQLGLLLSADANTNYVDEKTYSETIDLSWAFGLGYKIPKLNLGFDARYNLGLTSINTDNSAGSIKNEVFQFGIFYLFGKQ